MIDYSELGKHMKDPTEREQLAYLIGWVEGKKAVENVKKEPSHLL